MNNQNRRKFLKSGSTLGASLLATSAFSFSSDTSGRKRKINKDPEYRTLGTGPYSIKVSPVGLGCMGMSYHRSFIPDRNNSISVIRKAYDMGLNFFDTAEAYCPYKNEVLVGEAVKPFRKNIILCTKFGFEFQNNKMTGRLNSDPKHIRQVVEQSLKRLNTDVIDLLYQHRVDPNVPMEDVAGTVKDLIKEGKVKHFGLSEAGPDNIRKAHAVQPVTAIQSELSLLSRDPVSEIFPVCEELGIGFVPYSPLSRAFLSGYINERTKFNPDNDNRPSLPRYQPDAIRENWTIVNFLADFGNQRGYTAAQVTLAWLLGLKPYVVPIPGTTKLAHLQENIWSADLKLAASEMNEINDFMSKTKVIGSRLAVPRER
jgi:aryl-alcohol dehydrogenase-like predicted oxidoreductase